MSILSNNEITINKSIEKIQILEKQSCNQSNENNDRISNSLQTNQHNIEILGKHIYKILTVVENLDEERSKIAVKLSGIQNSIKENASQSKEMIIESKNEIINLKGIIMNNSSLNGTIKN